jgi:hypothetical protein
MEEGGEYWTGWGYRVGYDAMKEGSSVVAGDRENGSVWYRRIHGLGE